MGADEFDAVSIFRIKRNVSVLSAALYVLLLHAAVILDGTAVLIVAGEHQFCSDALDSGVILTQ